MPELPEVETVKNVLGPQIKGMQIEAVSVRCPDVIAHPAADDFCTCLTGQHILDMTRRGKFLNIRLESGDRIVLHLRMTGGLLLTAPAAPEEKHTHLVLTLRNETERKELRFADQRRFGRFWLLRAGETDTCTGMQKLGPEPFDHLTAAYLQAKLGRRRKAIKECLLDQTVIAGIGNIYADEILLSVGIHPAAPANTLQPAAWTALAAKIPERLAYFIEKNRITPEDYLLSKGKDYRNTPFLQVYGHAGEPCPICGSPLCRTVIGGRGSVYCPTCQKAPSLR